MSDGIEMMSVCCPDSLMQQKEGDVLNVRLNSSIFKHQENNIWYDSNLPVYTCKKCGKQWCLERVNK